MVSIFDFISVSYYFVKIVRNCAVLCFVQLLTNLFIQATYLETIIQWSDHSSVFKSPNRMKYLKIFLKGKWGNS